MLGGRGSHSGYEGATGVRRAFCACAGLCSTNARSTTFRSLPTCAGWCTASCLTATPSSSSRRPRQPAAQTDRRRWRQPRPTPGRPAPQTPDRQTPRRLPGRCRMRALPRSSLARMRTPLSGAVASGLLLRFCLPACPPARPTARLSVRPSVRPWGDPCAHLPLPHPCPIHLVRWGRCLPRRVFQPS
jgi:hypothetical protein